MSKLNLWRSFIYYLNNTTANYPNVNRKELMHWFNFDPAKEQTLDSYRRYLTVLGYLKRLKKPGYYSKVKDIPENLTLNEAKKLAYPKKEPKCV